MNSKFSKGGYLRVGIIVLILALSSVVATVIVAKNGTDFLNQASSKQSWIGEIRSVSPCVKGNLCYQLVKTDNGKNHYLLAVKSLPFEISALCINPVDKAKCKPKTGVNLKSYIGKGPVEVFGKIIDSSKPKYIYVTSVSKRVSATEQLPVTEIGTIVQEMLPLPLPTDPGVPVSSDGQTVSGNAGPSVDLRYVSPNSGGGSSEPNGSASDPDPVPGCRLRPACLDAKPACRVAMPEGGWCPPKKCTPRPACLDQGCEIAPPPGTQFCPPEPKLKSQFSLLTEDGRRYPLVSKTNSSCPKGAYCAEFLPTTINFSQFLGKTVLVEGTMVMKMSGQVSNRPCPTIYPPPPGCGGQKNSWWPLPDGVSFQASRVSIVDKVTSLALTDYINNGVSEPFGSEHVYQFGHLKPCQPDTFPCTVIVGETVKQPEKILVRSSFRDFEQILGRKVIVDGTVYRLQQQGEYVFDESKKSSCKANLEGNMAEQLCSENPDSYRYFNFTCSDGYIGKMGDATSCKTVELWEKYAWDECRKRDTCTVAIPVKPPVIGKACKSDQDCRKVVCKSPLKCPEINLSSVCVSGVCQIEGVGF